MSETCSSNGRRPTRSTSSCVAERSQANDEVLLTFEERVRHIRLSSSTDPFVLLLNLSKSWEQAVEFVRLDSRPWLPSRMPIVVLCPKAPPNQVIDELDLLSDERTGIIVGSPSWESDLRRSGVHECSMVVCLGQLVEHGRGGMIAEMLDADVLMVQRLLHRLGEAQKHVVLEFNRIDNMRLLSPMWTSHNDEGPMDLSQARNDELRPRNRDDQPSWSRRS